MDNNIIPSSADLKELEILIEQNKQLLEIVKGWTWVDKEEIVPLMPVHRFKLGDRVKLRQVLHETVLTKKLRVVPVGALGSVTSIIAFRHAYLVTFDWYKGVAFPVSYVTVNEQQLEFPDPREEVEPRLTME